MAGLKRVTDQIKKTNKIRRLIKRREKLISRFNSLPRRESFSGLAYQGEIERAERALAKLGVT